MALFDDPFAIQFEAKTMLGMGLLLPIKTKCFAHMYFHFWCVLSNSCVFYIFVSEMASHTIPTFSYFYIYSILHILTIVFP